MVMDPVDGIVHQVAGKVIASAQRQSSVRQEACYGTARAPAGGSRRKETPIIANPLQKTIVIRILSVIPLAFSCD